MYYVFSFNWVSVFIAAAFNLLIGYLWYSPWLFGKEWLKWAKQKPAKMNWWPHWILEILNSLLIAYALSFLAVHMGMSGISDGLFLGFLCWLGLVATVQIHSVLWKGNPWILFGIETGHKLFSFLIVGSVVTG